MNQGSACSFGQHFADQGPRYDNQIRKRKRRQNGNQVMSKQGIIRPDKRPKVKYL